jgi:hypothetical protein
MGYAGGDQNMDFTIGDVIDNEKASYCSEGCLDPWLADGFCDEGCNNAECAYDSGDCGFSHFERIQHEKTLNLSSTFQSEKNFHYSLEKGMTVVYWDLSNVFEKFKDIAIVPNTDSAIRSISLSQQHDTHYLTLILRNTSLVTLNITLQGRSKSLSEAAIFLHLVVDCDTTGHIPVSEPLVSQLRIFDSTMHAVRYII